MNYKRQMVFHRVLLENLKMINFVAGMTAFVIPVIFVYSLVMDNLIDNIALYSVAAVIFESFVAMYFMLSKNALVSIRRQRGYKKAMLIFRSFWLLYMAGALKMFAMSIEDSINIIVYLVITALLSFVPVFSNAEYAVVTIVELGIILGIVYNKNIIITSYQGIVLINAICAIISRIMYKNKVELYLLKNKIKNITKDALIDPLTKLLNRRGFEQQVRNIWPFCVRNEYKVALMIIDIDHFKEYNDYYGHPEGDECLKKVARSIRATAKRTTDISARFGGEEFVVFFQGNKDEEIVEFAERMRQNIENMKIPHSKRIDRKYVTVSIGLAISMPSKTDIRKIYEAADKELYVAKKRSRNAVSYSGTVKSAHSRLA